ncbi:MAG: hypothetical protein [Caudoviricetes sp.]|nr:MAG: hypothetical protein [Caudoviricetes sp.]
MNYFSPNYPGYNPYNNMSYPQYQQMPNQQNYQMNGNPQSNPQNQIQNQGLNGKIVDSEDVVKATEVPIGGYGIFPRADLSEIYIKSWNNNGTTSIITFKPVAPEPMTTDNNEVQNLNNILLQKINLLENKLDMVLNNGSSNVPNPNVSSSNSLLKNIDKEAEVQKNNGF